MLIYKISRNTTTIPNFCYFGAIVVADCEREARQMYPYDGEIAVDGKIINTNGLIPLMM